MVLSDSVAPIAVETIRSYIALAESNTPIEHNKRNEILDAFEAYECWMPFFRFIRKAMDADTAGIDDYVRLGRIQSVFLEDVFAAAETCVQAVHRKKLGYVEFQDRLLANIVEPEDFKVEATILQAVVREFAAKADIVAAYERLCLLFEKKIHNEDALNKSYQELLELEPSNIKALRYFKLMLTQSGDWREVARILEKLITCSHHSQDIFRLAQELAAVHLYQLDQPQEAIQVIEKHCADSPLDTSTIHYDAYQRIGDWRGCLQVLKSCLRRVDEDGAKSVLNYRIGVLHDQLGELDEALDFYQKAIKHWPSFLEPYEKVVGIRLKQRNWAAVYETLNTMTPQVHDEKLRPKIAEVMQRIDESQKHGRPKHD